MVACRRRSGLERVGLVGEPADGPRLVLDEEAAAASTGTDATATDGSDGASPADRVRAALARLQQRQNDEPYDPGTEPDRPEDAYQWPTTGQLIDRHFGGPLLEDIGVLHPGSPDRTYPSEVYMDIDLPVQATDPEIIEMRVDTSTRDLHPVEEFEGGTEIVHVEAQAEVAIRALVRNEDLPSRGAHSVLAPDVDEGWTQVRFDRQVIVEFDATVDVGAESAELEYAGATQLRG